MSTAENMQLAPEGTVQTVSFSALPTTLQQLTALPQATLKKPAEVAALVVAALCAYPENPESCIEMLNFLKGPSPMSAYDKQFLADRFSGKAYIARSYFEGATPENNYTPKQPFTVAVHTTKYSQQLINEGYLQLFLRSGGADSMRGIKLRHKPSSGQWFLWENLLMPSIRKPVAEDEWA